MRVVGLLVVVACSAPGAGTDASTSSSTATNATSPPTSLAPSTSTTTFTSTAPSTTTAAPTTTLGEPTTTTGQIDQGDLAGWETTTIAIGGSELIVALADDPAERRQGLMGVDDLGDLDGMLFQFPDEAISGFWMKDTLIALDIAFFGDDKGLVDSLSMVPCSTDSCLSYVPDAPFSWALETPAGSLEPLASGTTLSVGE